MVMTGGVSRRSDMLIEIGEKEWLSGEERKREVNQRSSFSVVCHENEKRGGEKREASVQKLGRTHPRREGGLERSLDEGTHRSLR